MPDAPPVVLDCGTGARNLGHKLVGEAHRELDLLFTHLHMDHVFGFPFFLPIYTPGYRLRIGVPAFSDDEAREKISRYLNGVYHPTRLRDLPSELSFHAVRSGRELRAGGMEVTTVSLKHPGGSMGYRLNHEGRSVVYVTDTSPFANPGRGVLAGEEPPRAEQRIIDFLQGADCVVYDTMYDVDEYLEKMTWGHSYPEYAVGLCEAAGVKHIVLYHHLPDATDEDLDALEAHWASHTAPRVTVAREGETLTVGEA